MGSARGLCAQVSLCRELLAVPEDVEAVIREEARPMAVNGGGSLVTYSAAPARSRPTPLPMWIVVLEPRKTSALLAQL